MDVFQAIVERRSCRNFKKASIPREDLVRIVDAARLAPSGANAQKWTFVVTTDSDTVERIRSALPHGKKYYPTFEDGEFENVSAIISLVFPANYRYYREDGGAAMENIYLAARALGYGTCWVQGQLQAPMGTLVRILAIPDDHVLFAMAMLGVPKAWPKEPPKKHLQEVLRWERFDAF
ncbi:MAG: nitroreductase family protein [Bacillota bacterium]